jgi:hypothetical protein
MIMDWLRQNVYIAAWASPLIALIGLMIRGAGRSGEMDWPRVMLYVAFLTCLAAALTPGLDATTRAAAGFVMFSLSGFFMGDIVARRNYQMTKKDDTSKGT